MLTSAAQLASYPVVLDIVEQLIGPDILVYNTTYIIKEAGTSSPVSWHQDLTYWGLDRDDRVALYGWLLQASTPNSSDDRRIGVNVQYIAPQVRQTRLSGYTAWLVRGEDRYGYYPPEQPARVDLDPEAVAWRADMQKLHREIAASQ